jgi:hypothetical protein
LVIIPLLDKIFSSVKQVEIAENVAEDMMHVDVGHRWFTASEEVLEEVSGKITKHHTKCLEERV